MRYRALDADGDMTFGRGADNYLVDSPEAVAQAVLTRLLLRTGEWFLDVTEGTPYEGSILGFGTDDTYDQAIKERILDTEGVTEITAYSSTLQNRALTITATISTLYGQTTVTTTL